MCLVLPFSTKIGQNITNNCPLPSYSEPKEGCFIFVQPEQ